MPLKISTADERARSVTGAPEGAVNSTGSTLEGVATGRSQDGAQTGAIRTGLENLSRNVTGTSYALAGFAAGSATAGTAATPARESGARESAESESGIGELGWLAKQWHTMLRIRRAEEAIAGLVESGEAVCPCHLYIGQEAVAAGVSAALEPSDSVWGGHRSHGHYLAKGGSLDGLLAEVLGKVTGCSQGRGGSMHLAAPEHGILGTVPIVAATVPLAAGAALAYKLRREPRVAVAYFGDGTFEEGHVHETLNLAAIYKLPMIFVCENNLYSSHLHWTQRRTQPDLFAAGLVHGVPGQQLDGNDVEAVYDAARGAVDRARSGGGPTLLECRTFRWRGHVGASSDLDVGVRRRGELDDWVGRDPVARAARALDERGPGWSERRERMEAAIGEEVRNALARARAAALPPAARVSEFVFSGPAGRN